VVHINGEDGWLGDWTGVPRSVGKGDLRTLTKPLASGLGQYGITVNDVSPASLKPSATSPLPRPATHRPHRHQPGHAALTAFQYLSRL
jgi:NAD(P)-dependent dehydrogenase (short-subunit alcohol dehydrogenase family)